MLYSIWSKFVLIQLFLIVGLAEIIIRDLKKRYAGGRAASRAWKLLATKNLTQ